MRLSSPNCSRQRQNGSLTAYAIEKNYALQLAASEKLPLFEQAVKEGIKPKLAAFTILSTTTELRRDGVDIRKIPDQVYLDTWHAVDSGKAAREAIPEISSGALPGAALLQKPLQNLHRRYRARNSRRL